MSYAKNTWQTGDVVTAEKLNRMEEGIEAASYNPVLANAKSTGGIGWTEHGEQTVITWDGDTEGRESVAGVYYKVSNSAPTIGVALTSFNFAGTEIPISEDYITEINEHAIFVGDGDSDYIIIADSDTSFEDIEINKGVYFYNTPNGYVFSLTYGTPDTVHKIDEKYLPEAGGGWPADLPKPSVGGYGYTDEDEIVHTIDEKYLPASGGVMIVNIEREYDTMVADKSFDEVYSAWKMGCVIARVDTGDGIVDLRPLTDVVTDTTTGLVFTGVTYTTKHGILYKLNWGSFSGVERFSLGFRNLQLTDI